MKPEIHPNYTPVIFVDASTGKEFHSFSTARSSNSREVDGVKHNLITLEVSSDSHPFWTGKMHRLDTAGRIERFEKRFANNIVTGKKKTRKEDKSKSED